MAAPSTTLKHDVGSVRKAMQQAAKEEVVATFALLAAGADLDAIEMEELRQLAKNLSGDRPARHR